ncbi:MAG: hypothetical protein ACRDMW_06785 [Gaiellaceae bacterium]
MPPPERPLKLGDLLAETIRIYGERLRAAIGLGLVYAAVLLGAAIIHVALYYVVTALMFTMASGVAVRLVAGDTFREAWAQVLVRFPVVLLLAAVVGLPFALAGYLSVLFILIAFWLGLTAFAVPAAMVEQTRGSAGTFETAAYALERTIALARLNYLHATGVVAALLIVNFVFGILLASLLVGFADNGRIVALAIVQVVLAPFFFLGLAVLYFEQRSRAAVSSGREPA